MDSQWVPPRCAAFRSRGLVPGPPPDRPRHRPRPQPQRRSPDPPRQQRSIRRLRSGTNWPLIAEPAALRAPRPPQLRAIPRLRRPPHRPQRVRRPPQVRSRRRPRPLDRGPPPRRRRPRRPRRSAHRVRQHRRPAESAHRRSRRRHRDGVLSARQLVQPHRHVLDAVDEVGRQPLGLADEAHLRCVGQHLGEHDLDLHLGQRHAEAVVRTATPKGDVLIR